jgi:MFS transporter, OFA family, oxalate/formate antiporter
MAVTEIHLAEKQAISRLQYVVIVTASLLVMGCSGAVYAWSIFVAPLKAEFGLSATQTQIIFGFIIGVFSIVMLFVNKVERKYGPKVSAGIGAVLFSTGYFVASLSGGRMSLLLLGISVLSGAGMAFGYVTVLGNLVKWFPHHKGLATGIAVSGFGGGAIMMSQIAQPLLNGGMAVLDIFRLVGLVYGIIFLIGALLLSTPPNSRYKESFKQSPVKYGKLIKDRSFQVLFFTFFAGSFAGLIFIGLLKPIGLAGGVSSYSAVLAISLFSLGNAAGRIIWGQVHDMMGGRKSVITALILLPAFILLLIPGSCNSLTFILLALIIGMCFGANFVLYASDVSEIYGIGQIDIIYPIVSMAYGISGIVGPLIGGFISDTTGGYYIAIIIAAVVGLSGMMVYALAMPRIRNTEPPAFKSPL